MFEPGAEAMPPDQRGQLQLARLRALNQLPAEIRETEDIGPAFELAKGRADALYVAADPLATSNRVPINTLALAARLPTMYGVREFVEAGGLMSYGPNVVDQYRRAADYVDKILRGTKPAEIPVEQPTKFDLVINLTTAKALGLTVPPLLLARPPPGAARGRAGGREEVGTARDPRLAVARPGGDRGAADAFHDRSRGALRLGSHEPGLGRGPYGCCFSAGRPALV